METGFCCRSAYAAPEGVSDSVRVSFHPVTSGFFETMGVSLLEGEDLNEVMKRRRRVGAEEAAAIVRQVAKALATAHQAGIIRCSAFILRQQPLHQPQILQLRQHVFHSTEHGIVGVYQGAVPVENQH